MSDIFLSLLKSNDVKIIELKEQLGDDFKKFLEIDKRINDQYLQELQNKSSKTNAISLTKNVSKLKKLQTTFPVSITKETSSSTPNPTNSAGSAKQEHQDPKQNPSMKP